MCVWLYFIHLKNDFKFFTGFKRIVFPVSKEFERGNIIYVFNYFRYLFLNIWQGMEFFMKLEFSVKNLLLFRQCNEID